MQLVHPAGGQRGLLGSRQRDAHALAPRDVKHSNSGAAQISLKQRRHRLHRPRPILPASHSRNRTPTDLICKLEDRSASEAIFADVRAQQSDRWPPWPGPWLWQSLAPLLLQLPRYRWPDGSIGCQRRKFVQDVGRPLSHDWSWRGSPSLPALS